MREPISETHTHDIEIVLTGRHRFPSVDQINIELPKNLGIIHASFVRPTHKIIAPGNNTAVSF